MSSIMSDTDKQVLAAILYHEGIEPPSQGLFYDATLHYIETGKSTDFGSCVWNPVDCVVRNRLTDPDPKYTLDEIASWDMICYSCRQELKHCTCRCGLMEKRCLIKSEPEI